MTKTIQDTLAEIDGAAVDASGGSKKTTSGDISGSADVSSGDDGKSGDDNDNNDDDTNDNDKSGDGGAGESGVSGESGESCVSYMPRRVVCARMPVETRSPFASQMTTTTARELEVRCPRSSGTGTERSLAVIVIFRCR